MPQCKRHPEFDFYPCCDKYTNRIEVELNAIKSWMKIYLLPKKYSHHPSVSLLDLWVRSKHYSELIKLKATDEEYSAERHIINISSANDILSKQLYYVTKALSDMVGRFGGSATHILDTVALNEARAAIAKAEGR